MGLSYTYSSDVWPALITLFLAIYLGAYSWRRRYIPAAKPFTVACIVGSLWTLGVILQIMAVDPSTKAFWLKYQALWQLPGVATMACFVLQYAGLGRFLTRRIYVLIFVVPFLSVLAITTNELHHLIWTGFQVSRHAVSWSPGKLHGFFNGFMILTGLFNFSILVHLAVRSPAHRLPVAVIMSSQIVGRTVYIINMLGVGWVGPGETIFFSVGLIAVGCAFAFLRLHALDPVAAARTAALDQMNEGLYALDLQGRILYANPVAAAIAGAPAARLWQKHLAEVLPIDPGLLDQMDDQQSGQTDLTLGVGGSTRRYSLLQTPLKGRKNHAIGRMLLLRDITEQWRAQEQVVEEQRKVAQLQEREHLARELHDGVGQILGYVSIQAQSALTLMQRGKTDKAGSVMDRVAEVAKDAHADIRESILALRAGSEQRKSFKPNLEHYLQRFQENFGIRTELSISSGIDENTFAPEVEANLLRVIQEALTNSRKHSGAHTLKVRVELDTSKALITVTDDGKGFDASRLGSSEGSHFGLVFMRERMEQIDGSLTIESTPNGGTALKLVVPVRSHEDKVP